MPPDIKVPKRVVIAPYLLLNDYFMALLGSSMDNAIPRFDGTSGQIQGSGVTIDDSNNLTVPGALRSNVDAGTCRVELNRNASSAWYILSDASGDLDFVEAVAATNTRVRITNSGDFYVVSGNMFAPAVYNNTTGNSSNQFVNSSGMFFRSTSAAKYKREFTRLDSERVAQFLRLVGGTYYSLCEGDNPDEMFSGVLADQAHELGLTDLVNYNKDGEPEGFRYERGIAYFLEAFRSMDARISALEAKAP